MSGLTICAGMALAELENNVNEMTVIEISGVKMEVDLRTAKRIETLRVGSKVKLLRKKYDGYEVHHGIVVGFEPFEKLPTIIVCYLVSTYNEAKLEFAYINENSKKEEIELVASIDGELPIAKADVLARIDREIEKKHAETEDLQQKRAYFLSHFNAYFERESA